MSRLLKHINPQGNFECTTHILLTRLMLMCFASSFIETKVLGIKETYLSEKSASCKNIKQKMYRKSVSFDNFLKELAKTWHMPCLGINSNNINPCEEESIVCHVSHLEHRMMTKNELKLFHEEFVGLRRNKHTIFNARHPKCVRLNHKCYTRIPKSCC